MYNLINQDTNTIILSGKTIISFVKEFRKFLNNPVNTGFIDVQILINEGSDKNSFGRKLTEEEFQNIMQCMREQNLNFLN